MAVARLSCFLKQLVPARPQLQFLDGLRRAGRVGHDEDDPVATGFDDGIDSAAYDHWSRDRIHRVYYWAIPLLVISVPARLMLSTTGAWRSFAEFVTR